MKMNKKRQPAARSPLPKTLRRPHAAPRTIMNKNSLATTGKNNDDRKKAATTLCAANLLAAVFFSRAFFCCPIASARGIMVIVRGEDLFTPIILFLNFCGYFASFIVFVCFFFYFLVFFLMFSFISHSRTASFNLFSVRSSCLTFLRACWHCRRRPTS
jgi:hypothetical protein